MKLILALMIAAGLTACGNSDKPVVAATPAVVTAPVVDVAPTGIAVNNLSFGTDQYGIYGVLRFSVKNDTDKEIIAWKGRFVCRNAFGEEAFALNLSDDSSNIKPGKSDSAAFQLNPYEKAGKLVLTNDAKNFKCGFTSITLAQ